MNLTQADLKNRAAWEQAGIRVYEFDRDAVTAATKAAPTWVHFGCGNLFRAFHAAVAQHLLDSGDLKTGIVVAEGFDYEIIDLMNRPHDDLSLAVTLKADGSIEKEVIGSVVESLKLDSTNETEFGRLKEIFRNPSLQMCTFTITEKGYNLYRGGEFAPDVAKDMAAGPDAACSYMGKVAALCYTRYLAGELPIAMVSTDNCSHNGDKLRDAICTFAAEWVKAGLAEAGFVTYLSNPEKVSFPWSMIDKITPRPDDDVKRMLKEAGFEDVENVRTSKNTFVAPFVNAEETQYLVIEDHFPNGHPCLEKGGIIFTQRETVDKVERMKVCTCLNPLHTAMSIYGCVLGHTRICDEMKDEDIAKFITRIGYEEAMPVVVNPGILNPQEFLKTVLEVRFPNPFMPDTPQRIATDTSQKLAIRFGETIKNYLADEKLDVQNLKLIPLVQAGWCRYLMGIDDAGNAFEVSPDPLYDSVSGPFRALKLGEAVDVHALLGDLLKRRDIFGVDLYEAGLGERVEQIFAKLIAGPGAVRATLHEAVNA